MQRIRMILFAAAILVFGRGAWADVATDERDLKQLSAHIQAAVVKEDLPFLKGVLHEDYVHTRPNGIVRDRTGFLESIKRDETQPNVNYDKLTATDIKVRLLGDTAILAGQSGIKSDDAQGTLKGETRWTRVFVRHNGTWKAVAFQATMVGQ